jgi:hypothetical protein
MKRDIIGGGDGMFIMGGLWLLPLFFRISLLYVVEASGAAFAARGATKCRSSTYR